MTPYHETGRARNSCSDRGDKLVGESAKGSVIQVSEWPVSEGDFGRIQPPKDVGSRSACGAQEKYEASPPNFRSALIKQPFAAPPSKGGGGSQSLTPHGRPTAQGSFADFFSGSQTFDFQLE